MMKMRANLQMGMTHQHFMDHSKKTHMKLWQRLN